MGNLDTDRLGPAWLAGPLLVLKAEAIEKESPC